MDFSWLNEVPDSAWRRWDHQGRSYMEMSKDEFRRRSKVVGDQYWERSFEDWGVTQPRRYNYLNRLTHLWLIAELESG